MKPILFNSEMVRAILDGRKTQTRRIAGLSEVNKNPDGWIYSGINDKGDHLFVKKNWQELGGDITDHTIIVKSPYGKVGDVMYVKEAYRIREYSGRRNTVGGKYLTDDKEFWTEICQDEYELIHNRKYPYRGASGRFMYKSLARIFLEITNIRVGRVQDITWQES